MNYEIAYSGTGDSKHGKILSAILDRVTLSENEMSNNFDRYRKAEQKYLLYKKKTKQDQAADDQRKAGKDEFTTIVVPASYALLLTAHTYWCSVFLQRAPIFQYDGRHGEGQNKTRAMESMIQYQVRVGKMVPDFYVWLLDVGRYGVGILGNYWAEEYVIQNEIAEVEVTEAGVPTGKFEKAFQRKKVPGYKGNKVYNILPYDFLPDPRVAMSKLQDGEFCGRKTNISWNDLVKGKADGKYFNTDKVKGIYATQDTTAQRFMADDGMQPDVTGMTLTPKGGKQHFVDIIEMTIELVPKDWGLGSSEYPEKWVFTVAGRKVIIGAQPLGMLHDKFPFHVLEAEVDGYKQASRSILEVSDPLNDVLSWLFNSHMHNKRAMLNDKLIYDPSKVVVKDINDPRPGSRIRLKPSAYGTDARMAVHQLQTHDSTMQNLQDTGVVSSLMQRMLGISDDLAGQASPSSRRSATEFRGTTGFSANRLQNMANYFSVTGWDSLSECLVKSTQQLYDGEMTVKVAGDTVAGVENVTVSPEDIAGFFDFIPADGTLPVDRMEQAQFLQQAIMGAMQIPGLASQYRLGDMFEEASRLAGIKNIGKFKIEVVDDAVVAQMIDAEKLRPMGNSGGTDANTGAAGGTFSQLAGTGESPAGATGFPGMGNPTAGGQG